MRRKAGFPQGLVGIISQKIESQTLPSATPRQYFFSSGPCRKVAFYYSLLMPNIQKGKKRGEKKKKPS